MASKQSYWWYIPIVMVLILGYGIGGCLVFGLHFLGWLPSLTDDTARLVLKLPQRCIKSVDSGFWSYAAF